MGYLWFAGIDIANNEHIIGAIGKEGEKNTRPMSFKNSEAGFEKCAPRFEGIVEDAKDIVIAMETINHY